MDWRRAMPLSSIQDDLQGMARPAPSRSSCARLGVIVTRAVHGRPWPAHDGLGRRPRHAQEEAVTASAATRRVENLARNCRYACAKHESVPKTRTRNRRGNFRQRCLRELVLAHVCLAAHQRPATEREAERGLSVFHSISLENFAKTLPYDSRPGSL